MRSLTLHAKKTAFSCVNDVHVQGTSFMMP